MPKLSPQILQDAWIGDAVLSLYARLKILEQDGRIDGQKCARMTSNQFLAIFGEPSRVEAEIGVVFICDGMEAAFSWIDEKLMMAFLKQEENRTKR